MLAKTATERKILQCIEPVADSLDFAIVRVRILGGRVRTLQIMAEKKGGGMPLASCGQLSSVISLVLDESDIIQDKYTLEVSSPGIDRPLTRICDFKNAIGYLVRIESEEHVSIARKITGYVNDVIDIRLDNSEDLGVNDAYIMLGIDAKKYMYAKRAEAVEDEVRVRFSLLNDAKLVLTDGLISDAFRRGSYVANDNG
mgnify:CR=1 FL=1